MCYKFKKIIQNEHFIFSELKKGNVTSVMETLVSRPVTLECPVVAPADAEIFWTRNDVPLFPGTDGTQASAL